MTDDTTACQHRHIIDWRSITPTRPGRVERPDVPRTMSPELLELVADRFKLLSDPARLRILNGLRDGERSVGEIVEATGLSQANVSKHLAMLHGAGFVRRRKAGLFTMYVLADKTIFRLSDLMCGRIEAEAAGRAKILAR
jgi:DNA-binding transcriptional ArsR family regulator